MADHDDDSNTRMALSKENCIVRRFAAVAIAPIMTAAGQPRRVEPDAMWTYKQVSGKALKMSVFLPDGYDGGIVSRPSSSSMAAVGTLVMPVGTIRTVRTGAAAA